MFHRYAIYYAKPNMPPAERKAFEKMDQQGGGRIKTISINKFKEGY